MKRICRRWGEDEKDYLRRRYPVEGGVAVAEALCRTYASVCKMAARLGVSVPASVLEEVRHKSRAKASATIGRLYRMERFRIRSGMSQQTKRVFNEYPKRVKAYVYNAVYRRHYFHCEDEPFDVLYYDDKTLRTPNEALMAKRYGVKFVKWTEGSELSDNSDNSDISEED